MKQIQYKANITGAGSYLPEKIVTNNDLEKLIPSQIPMFKGNFAIKEENTIYKGKNVTAFAGIAYPEKFFNSLEKLGAKIVKRFSFSDHYIYNENDLLTLAESANKTKSILVTTRKDFVRIPKSYRSLINTLNGEIIFENEELLSEILSNIIENYFINNQYSISKNFNYFIYCQNQ